VEVLACLTGLTDLGELVVRQQQQGSERVAKLQFSNKVSGIMHNMFCL
jgi:hypothetical protein